MLAYKPKITTIMIKNLSIDTPVDYYPKNERTDVICEMKEIIKSFEFCESGLIETKDALYHYATIQQQIKELNNEQIEEDNDEIEEEGERLFVIIRSDPNYPEEGCNECINRISAIFQLTYNKSSTNANANVNSVVISQFRKKMYDLFKEYNTTDAVDLINKFHKSAAENTTMENTEEIHATFKQDYSDRLIKDNEEIMVINQGIEDSKELRNDDIEISIGANKGEIKDNDTYKNDMIEQGEEKGAIDQNNPNVLLYQRLSPWKTIKVIYIIICSVIIISVIISIFLLTQ